MTRRAGKRRLRSALQAIRCYKVLSPDADHLPDKSILKVGSDLDISV